MKELTETLRNKIINAYNAYNKTGRTTCRWNDIYDTEEELIKDLFNEKVLTDEDTSISYKICRGYEYIKSFRKFYKKNGYLTPKQITQLKRIAYAIAYNIYCT